MRVMQAHHHLHPTDFRGRMQAVLKWSMMATLALVATEFVAGYLGRSIALISDAVHNLSDVPALVISWLALRWAERPPDHEKTYGYHRAGILASYTNAILLVLVAGFLLYESYERLRHPVDVREGVMLVVALAGLVINGGITLALARGRHDLNLRTILIHNFGDALSDLAIVAGALAIRWTGVQRVDPVLGLGIGVLVLWSSLGVLKESSHILLEGLPRQIRLDDVVRAILGVEGVAEVHDLHIWTLGTNLHALSCHVRIPDMHMEESERILERVQERLAREFHITHTTIQFERAGPAANRFYMPAPYDSSRE